MEFQVDENGCNELINEMLNQMHGILDLIGSLNEMAPLVRAALNEDSSAIESAIATMLVELEGAQKELNTIRIDMKEYVQRIKPIHDSLHG